MFTTRPEYAIELGRCEAFMSSLAAAVKAAANSGSYTAAGLFEVNAVAKGNAIFETNRTLDAIAAMAKADRAAAEEVLDGPEPLQSAETLAALQYAQNIAMRQYPDGGDTKILDALADAVEDGDAIRAQVLSDLAAGIRWSIDNLERMDQFERLRKRAIALRADPARAAALATLALLDGDRDTAGVDGKAEVVRYAVGQRADAILRKGGDDQMVGSFRLDWVTPPPLTRGAPMDYAGTVRMLGVIPPLTR